MFKNFALIFFGLIIIFSNNLCLWALAPVKQDLSLKEIASFQLVQQRIVELQNESNQQTVEQVLEDFVRFPEDLRNFWNERKLFLKIFKAANQNLKYRFAYVILGQDRYFSFIEQMVENSQNDDDLDWDAAMFFLPLEGKDWPALLYEQRQFLSQVAFNYEQTQSHKEFWQAKLWGMWSSQSSFVQQAVGNVYRKASDEFWIWMAEDLEAFLEISPQGDLSSAIEHLHSFCKSEDAWTKKKGFDQFLAVLDGIDSSAKKGPIDAFLNAYAAKLSQSS